MAAIFIKEVLGEKRENQTVTLRGWVYRKREGKQLIFLVLRDSTGIIQCTVKADSQAWTQASQLTIESSLTLRGTVKVDKRAPGGYEISVEEIDTIGLAEVFPIAKDQSEEFLRDIRHLWLQAGDQPSGGCGLVRHVWPPLAVCTLYVCLRPRRPGP